MNNIKKKAYCFILFAFAMLPFRLFSQNHVTMSMQNVTATANSIEFDVFIVNDGTTAIKLRAYSFGVNFNLSILNGATPLSSSYIYMPGTRDALIDALPVTSSAYNNSQLKNTVVYAPVANAVNLPIGLQIRLGRFKFTNTVNWTSSSTPDLAFQLTQATGKTQCIVVVYSDSAQTTYTLLNPISVSNPVSTLNPIISIPNLTLNGTPLPVNILNFAGVKSGNEHLLSWTTNREENNHYFSLQHSTDGIYFNTINKIYSLAEGGNSSTTLHYASKNVQPVVGHNFYRLEQVDIDGKATVESHILDIPHNSTGTQILIYPKPSKGNLNIDFESDQEKNVVFKITDMTGRTMKTFSSNTSVGSNTITIDLSAMSSGNYFIQMFEDDTEVFTDKILIAK